MVWYFAWWSDAYRKNGACYRQSSLRLVWIRSLRVSRWEKFGRTHHMNLIFRSLVVTVLSVAMFAQQPRVPRSGTGRRTDKVTAEDIQSLREALAAQQQMLEELRAELHKRDQTIQDVHQKAEQAQSSAATAQENSVAAAYDEKQAVSKLQNDLTSVRNSLYGAL